MLLYNMSTLSAREFYALRASLMRNGMFSVSLENPSAVARFSALFSSLDSGNKPSAGSVAGTGRDSVEIDGLGSADNGHGWFSKMGLENNDNRGLSSHEDDQGFGFGGVEELGESENSDDEEEEEEEEEEEDDLMSENFPSRTQNEDVVRVVQYEDELRNPLVREVCRLVGLRSNWNPKLEGELRHMLRSLSPRQACAVLHSFDDERVALKLFYWADRQWRYRHDPAVYYAMLEVLGKTKMCQGARRVLQLMKRRRVHRSPEAFGHVMVSYSRAGKLRKALQVLTLMQKAGVGVNLSICNTAVHVLVMGDRLDKALRFVERMEIFRIKPNVVTYNCLIKGYCKISRIGDALGLFDEMPGKGCFPDKVSYYTVMGFLCESKRVNEVRELMEKMKEKGLVPDQVTYHVLVHGLSKHGHGNEALELLKDRIMSQWEYHVSLI